MKQWLVKEKNDIEFSIIAGFNFKIVNKFLFIFFGQFSINNRQSRLTVDAVQEWIGINSKDIGK